MCKLPDIVQGQGSTTTTSWVTWYKSPIAAPASVVSVAAPAVALLQLDDLPGGKLLNFLGGYVIWVIWVDNLNFFLRHDGFFFHKSRNSKLKRSKRRVDFLACKRSRVCSKAAPCCSLSCLGAIPCSNVRFHLDSFLDSRYSVPSISSPFLKLMISPLELPNFCRVSLPSRRIKFQIFPQTKKWLSAFMSSAAFCLQLCSHRCKLRCRWPHSDVMELQHPWWCAIN